jgi:hypothetical protein
MRAQTSLPLALLAAGLLAGCAVAPSSPAAAPTRGRLITAEQVRASGATNAFQALERNPRHLRIGPMSDGDLVVRGARSHGSPYGSGEPLLVVDGVRMVDVQALRNIPAQAVASIEFLTASEAMLRYGTGSNNGAIVVRTAPTPLW